MKKMIGLLSVLCFAVVLPASADMNVRCDSNDGRYNECAAGFAEAVSVARQWSTTKCLRGVNWGYRDGYIWVDEGCRADFKVIPSTMISSSSVSTRAYKTTLICESQDGHRRHCAADTSGGVRITKRLSRNACEFRDDWGWDENGVWVSHGCRAEFEVTSTATPPALGASTADRILICESENGRRKHCPADTTRGVTVFRQISDSDCIMNRTWGFDSNGVWVTSGCRAQFLLNPR